MNISNKPLNIKRCSGMPQGVPLNSIYTFISSSFWNLSNVWHYHNWKKCILNSILCLQLLPKWNRALLFCFWWTKKGYLGYTNIKTFFLSSNLPRWNTIDTSLLRKKVDFQWNLNILLKYLKRFVTWMTCWQLFPLWKL